MKTDPQENLSPASLPFIAQLLLAFSIFLLQFSCVYFSSHFFFFGLIYLFFLIFRALVFFLPQLLPPVFSVFSYTTALSFSQDTKIQKFSSISCFLANSLAQELRSLSVSCLKRTPCHPTLIQES